MLTFLNADEDRMTIQVTGEFDAVAAQNMRGQLERIAATWDGDIDLDLSMVDFIDSSGIGAIVFLGKRLRERDRRIALLGVSGQPREVIQMLRIDRLITVEFSKAPARAES